MKIELLDTIVLTRGQPKHGLRSGDLGAVVEVYEFEPCMLHHKTMIVDGVWATIGTANFDNRSFALNNETNICINDATLVAQLERVFERDLKRCKPISRELWSSRRLWYRLQVAAASILEDQV